MSRTLSFSLRIETDLGENDEVQPTVNFVCDWLNDNNYGYAVLSEPSVRSSHTWHGGIVDMDTLHDPDPPWKVGCDGCDWTLVAPQSVAVAAGREHQDNDGAATSEGTPDGWDGHTTEQKYERLVAWRAAALATETAQP